MGVHVMELGSGESQEAKKGEELEFNVEEVEFDVGTPERIMQEGIANEYRDARLGLIVGALTIVVGAVFIMLGYAWLVDLTFQTGSSKGHIVTGSLGIVVASSGRGSSF